MTCKYKAATIDQLIEVPTRLQNKRARAHEVAGLLTTTLNEMSKSGWDLVTTYHGADSTIFIFAQPAETEDSC